MTTMDTISMQSAPSAKFWDRMAERYARTPVADEEAYQTKLRITRDHLRSDMDVLEFGCGTGSTALAHAPFVKHILATDISSKMIEIARDKAETAGIANVAFECAAIDSYTAPDESFDAVLGLNILHLLANKDAAISKVWKMLKPGGVFVSSTVCLGEGLHYFRLIAPIGHALGFFPLVKVFRVDQLQASLAACGFEIDHLWRPETRGANALKSVFIVARKPALG